MAGTPSPRPARFIQASLRTYEWCLLSLASVALHERRRIAVLGIPARVEQLRHPARSAVVGEQRQVQPPAVALQQIVQVAEPEPQVGVALVQLARRETRLVQTRGAREHLRQSEGALAALGAGVEPRLDPHQPEGQDRVHPFGERDVVGRGREIGGNTAAGSGEPGNGPPPPPRPCRRPPPPARPPPPRVRRPTPPPP